MTTSTVPTSCTGPGCARPARAMGLCSSHYQQRVRGLQLSPLRQRPAEPLVTLGLRVPQLVRAAASADPAGARAALLAWVAARDARHPIAAVSDPGVLATGSAGVRHALAPVSKPEKPARTRRWRCTRCNGVFRLPWRLPPEQACASRITRSGLPCGGGLVPAGLQR
jgi:hypothetical protein